jgi:hypothetical protein
VIARQVGDETVLLDLASGTYFGLDPVGARIWQLIETGKSLREVCDQMVEEYDVARQVLEQDTLALARDLVEKKLISVN